MMVDQVKISAPAGQTRLENLTDKKIILRGTNGEIYDLPASKNPITVSYGVENVGVFGTIPFGQFQKLREVASFNYSPDAVDAKTYIVSEEVRRIARHRKDFASYKDGGLIFN